MDSSRASRLHSDMKPEDLIQTFHLLQQRRQAMRLKRHQVMAVHECPLPLHPGPPPPHGGALSNSAAKAKKRKDVGHDADSSALKAAKTSSECSNQFNYEHRLPTPTSVA